MSSKIITKCYFGDGCRPRGTEAGGQFKVALRRRSIHPWFHSPAFSEQQISYLGLQNPRKIIFLLYSGKQVTWTRLSTPCSYVIQHNFCRNKLLRLQHYAVLPGVLATDLNEAVKPFLSRDLGDPLTDTFRRHQAFRVDALSPSRSWRLPTVVLDFFRTMLLALSGEVGEGFLEPANAQPGVPYYSQGL